MLYFHGNGCDAEMMLVYGQDLRQLAARMKCHLLFVEYPGYGCCAGAPSETSCLRTAQQAFAFVRDKLRVPSERIIVFGTSIGGGVAVELAARLAAAGTGRLRGLILQCTFTSIRRLGLDLGVPRWSSYLFQDRFDNQTRLQQCDPNTPVYLFHGARDELIPPQHSQQLLDCSPARHKRLLVVPGATHAYFPTTSWMTDCCRFFEEDVPTLKDVPLPPPLPANVAELAMPAPTAEALEQRYEAQRRQSEASANRVRSLEGVMQGIARAMMRIAGWFP